MQSISVKPIIKLTQDILMKTIALAMSLAAALLPAAYAQQFQLNGVTFSSQKEFVQLGFRCGTPVPPSVQRTQDRARLSTFRTANAALPLGKEAKTEIPIHMHVIQDADGGGDVTDAVLDSQVTTLNKAYDKYGFHFTRASVDRTKNNAWFHMGYGSTAEVQAKSTLGKDQDASLNLYFASIGGGLLGWATFPSDLAAKPKMDGVVILNTSVPGGSAVPYDQGKTAVHEVGHWLGLYHTFQDGCQAPGDEVDDTPAEDSPATGTCAQNHDRDSCPAPGLDDISNFMDYTDDECMDHFTAGQTQRMHLQVSVYRSKVLPTNIKAMRVAIPLE
jgi:hypothetical protein